MNQAHTAFTRGYNLAILPGLFVPLNLLFPRKMEIFVFREHEAAL